MASGQTSEKTWGAGARITAVNEGEISTSEKVRCGWCQSAQRSWRLQVQLSTAAVALWTETETRKKSLRPLPPPPRLLPVSPMGWT